MRRHPVILATTISALLSAIYLLWQPQTLDLAAQVFRADLWEREGWVVWDASWYGGQTIPGYSLLYPPLGALLGPELLGALCAVASAALFALIAERAYGERAWLGAAWFGLASTVALYGGRITFALGLVFGLAAILALQRQRPLVGAGAAILAGLASPVAGLFTALAAAAATLAPGREPWSRRRTQAAAVAVGGLAGAAALSLAFPTDGFQPFVLSALLPVVAACALALLALPADERVLRAGALLYAGLALLAFAIETPLGGNVVRLGTTLAGPLLALALFHRRPLVLALAAAPLLWWQWTATVRDVAAAEGDPAVERGYYEPLLQRLATEPLADGRLHVPPTRNRWESAYVAPAQPLARGWLRQLESEDIELFTEDRLSPTRYARWLYRHGVAHVAVPDAELDYIAEDEVELIEAGDLPFLRPVWEDEHWRLYEVRATDGSPPPATGTLASGGATVRTTLDGYDVSVPRPGDYLLYLRYSPYLEVVRGRACLEDAGDGATRLTVPEGAAGAVESRARLSFDGFLRTDRACAD